MAEQEDHQQCQPPLPPASLSPPATSSKFITRSRALFNQLSISEISGSVGDLGTFVPLVVALTKQDCIELCPTLFWAGFSNVITGWVWDVPMCVQPMKSIAAVAIAQNMSSKQQVTTAGIWMGIFMILLSVTDGIEMINWLIPVPIVSGIQIGVGINLSIRGIKLIQDLSWLPTNNNNSGLDCRLVSVLVALLCLYWLRESTSSPRDRRTSDNATINPQNNDNENGDGTDNDDDNHPAGETSHTQSATTTTATPPPPPPVGLYLFGLGMILALLHLVLFPPPTTNQEDSTSQSSSSSWFFGGREPITWALKNVTWKDWKQGLLQGAIPQLPLTTLNSVVSVCCLAHTLYPEKRRRNHNSNRTDSDTDESTAATTTTATTTTTTEDAVVSRREVSWSVGMMNLVLCPLGAMPCCHGAGGLAGQHKFGARHGASVVFLGINKMLVSIVLGGTLLRVLEALPNSILGLMLVVCGHELALMGWTVLVVNSTSTTTTTRPQQRQRQQQDINWNDGDEEVTTSAETISTSGIPLEMKNGAVVTLITVIVDVGLHKTHYAALTGWVAYMIYGDGIKDYRAQWNSRSNSTQSRAEYSPIVAYQELQTTNDDDDDPLQPAA